MKNRIAIWLQGGIGGGNFSQGYPPLVNFVTKLSSEYEITVYSFFPANEDFVPQGFKLRTVTRRISYLKLRTVLVCFLFLWDHVRRPYNLLHAFWVYPAGTIAVLLGKITRTPSIVTIQGGEAAALAHINYGNMLKPMLKKITLWTCEKATHLNSISEFLINEMHKHGLKRRDASVIPFGTDLSRFKRSDKVEDDLLRVIHVANINEVKDQVTLLRAFELLLKNQPAELRIVGGDFMGGKLQKVVTEMKLDNHVKFTGAVPNKELQAHYAWANIMMHTSLHEGQCGVIAEAMASGVVVFGTRVGMISDLGEDYFKVVSVGDYHGLALKVVELWNDKGAFRALQEKAFLWANEFDASWTIKKYSDLYKRIIKE